MTSVLKVDNIKNSSGTDAISIDSSGVVTKSVVPAFFARNSAHTYITTGQYVIYNTVSDAGCFNQGGHYSTTTGTFTAPVEGVYSFAAQIYSNAQTRARMYWRLNDSNIAGSQVNSGNDESDYEGLEMAITIKLAVGDTIRIYSDSPGYHQNSGLSYFCGHLVG